MFIVDWLFDKMGYTKKVDIVTMFGSYKVNLDLPERQKPVKKVATKRKTVAKKSVKKKA